MMALLGTVFDAEQPRLNFVHRIDAQKKMEKSTPSRVTLF